MPAVLHCIGDLKQKTRQSRALSARKGPFQARTLSLFKGEALKRGRGRPRSRAPAKSVERRGQTAARFNGALLQERQRDCRAGRPPSDWEKTKKPADRISGPRVLPLATMDVCR